MTYHLEYKPQHDRADIMGFVPAHALVAEKVLGRPLQQGEVVHHKDFNKLNNDKGNLLFPITRKEHQQLPAFQAQFIIKKGLYDEFLEWWRQVKDEVNEEYELEKKLAKATNDKKRLEIKLKSQQRKD